MYGTVVRVTGNKGFGFVKGDDDKVDYFFHKDDYVGDFNVLSDDVSTGRRVRVQFMPGQSPKGPRASNVCPALHSR